MPLPIGNILALFADVSIKTALLAVIAGGLLFVLRVRNANLQHRVWSAVLAAMLGLPLLIGVVPRVPVPIVKFASAAAVRKPEAVPVAAPATAAQNSVEPVVTDRLTTRTATPVSDSIRDAKRAVEPATAPTLVLSSMSWPQAIAFAYLAGLAWFALRLFIGVWRARQLVRYSHSIELPFNQQEIIGATSVRESSLIRVPLTVGWLRPTIVLPSDWRSWDNSLLTAVLSHEQEHVRRGDPSMTLLAEVNRAIYWFHPVAWFLRRRLSALAEAACDDSVVASSGDRASYARHLLTVARRLTGEPRRLAPASVAMARTPQVERRINAVLDSSRPLARRVSVAARSVIVVVATSLTVFVATLQARDEKPTETTQPPAPAMVARDRAPSSLLSVGPIQELGNEAGGHTFEFPITVPKGRKFGVSFGGWPVPTAVQTYALFHKGSDGPSTATLRLQRTSSFRAKERGDILLGAAERLDFRLKIPGCSPEEVSTLAGVPLVNLPGDERKLMVISPDSPLAQANTGIRLLLIVPKDQNPKTAADVEKITPRGELIVSLEPEPDPQSGLTLRESLERTWRRADSGVGTLFVRSHPQLFLNDWLKPLEVDAVRKIVQDAAARNLKPGFGASATDAEQSKRFVDEITQNVADGEAFDRAKFVPSHSDFRMVGERRLEIRSTESAEEPFQACLSDGGVNLEYNAGSKKLAVWGTGQVHRNLFFGANEGPDDFRTSLRTEGPTPFDIGKLLASASVRSQPDGRAVISYQHGEVIADPKTGFIELFTQHSGSAASKEIYQFGPKEFPGQQTFPRLRVICDYQDGKLRMVKIVSNDEVRVNEGFHDSDFILKLPAGVTVSDSRVDGRHPDVFKVDTEIPDAAEFAKTLRGRDSAAEPPKE